MASEGAGSVDPGKVAKFAEMSGRWWENAGPFAILHRMTPVILGLVLAVPFACALSGRSWSRSFLRWRLCAALAELSVPPELTRAGVGGRSASASGRSSSFSLSPFCR